MSKNTVVDVAIVGGGPAGSTLGTLLKKYDSNLKVTIFERERFPRDHVGESQLPPISEVLHEMGCWEKVEAANFPIKIGATYKWGSTDDLWDFEFLPGEAFRAKERPGKYEGQRKSTAFQVDRAIYDKILLDHAAELGVDVREETRVTKVNCVDGRVTSLEVNNDETVEARYVVDASGSSGIVRRALGVELDEPTTLRNIAIWDYWQNADWAVSIGVGGTRVQVLSVGYGWLWFIPLGPTRTSIGLVCPADYPKTSGLKPEELYLKAIADEPLITDLVRNAEREGPVLATKDWSFVAKETVGENWFLVGESAGFADPILAAGMTMAHRGARECAYTILELDRKRFDADWLKHEFGSRQTKRIMQHIRFADYWYSHNGHFTELQDWATTIAKDAGLDLTRQKGWQWMGTGGFIGEELDGVAFGGYRLGHIRSISKLLTGEDDKWEIESKNVFDLIEDGAEERVVAAYRNGEVREVRCLFKGAKSLPLVGSYGPVIDALRQRRDGPSIINYLRKGFLSLRPGGNVGEFLGSCLETLEGMIHAGWVEASYSGKYPLLNLSQQEFSPAIHPNRDNRVPGQA